MANTDQQNEYCWRFIVLSPRGRRIFTSTSWNVCLQNDMENTACCLLESKWETAKVARIELQKLDAADEWCTYRTLEA
jgi:hypothetical protein